MTHSASASGTGTRAVGASGRGADAVLVMMGVLAVVMPLLWAGCQHSLRATGTAPVPGTMVGLLGLGGPVLAAVTGWLGFEVARRGRPSGHLAVALSALAVAVVGATIMAQLGAVAPA